MDGLGGKVSRSKQLTFLADMSAKAFSTPPLLGEGG